MLSSRTDLEVPNRPSCFDIFWVLKFLATVEGKGLCQVSEVEVVLQLRPVHLQQGSGGREEGIRGGREEGIRGGSGKRRGRKETQELGGGSRKRRDRGGGGEGGKRGEEEKEGGVRGKGGGGGGRKRRGEKGRRNRRKKREGREKL